MPDTTTLLALGAKDPVGLASGEWWRLAAPMFIHVGLVHFGVNSYMLSMLGPQLERILGGRWFMAIYLAAGVLGNVASAVFSANLSAGASSSLFGLLGAGFLLERAVGRRITEVTGRKPQNRAYAATLAINLVFGAIVPFIDNSAHLGGLAAGVVLTFAMMNLRPNSLQMPRRNVGIAAVAMLVVVCGVGARFALDPKYLRALTERAGDRAGDFKGKLMHYSQAIEILGEDPGAAGLRLKRARAALEADEDQLAWHDVRIVATEGGHMQELQAFADELAGQGRETDAWQVRRLAEHGGEP
jgi:rhomboid protease GluP